MIRRLFFAATLLLPCLAYGEDSSSNLSVDVVPPGSQPPAPAGAAAAGFTTLALNSDFTQAMPSNWLGGCSVAGSGAPVNTNDNTGHTWWMNIWWAWTYQHCLTKQVTDLVAGSLVLDMPWTVDTGALNVGTTLQSAAWFSTGQPNTGVTFPNNAYYEITYRISPVAPGSWGGMFTWPLLGMTDNNQQGIEHVIIELDTGRFAGSDAGIHNWGVPTKPGSFIWLGQGSPGLPNNFDANQYHTFAIRSTSDGNTLSDCAYIDNVLQSCVPVPGGLTSIEANAREVLILQNACDYWNGPCNTGLQHMYVKNVRVWSCANWQTTQCNGSVLTAAP
jgi:hypothetical protein